MRALRDITVLVDGQAVLVAAQGEVGGWVEGEDNLSAAGSAWVGGDAKVFDGARVEDDALVTEFAEVSDGAVVRDQAQVSGRARVFGDARVSDEAQVGNAAVVCSGAMILENATIVDNALVCGHVPSAFASSFRQKDSKGSYQPAHLRLGSWLEGWSEIGVRSLPTLLNVDDVPAVLGNAMISDRGQVLERSRVFGQAIVTEGARVHGGAQIFDDAHVSGNAQVFGSARVFGAASSQHIVAQTVEDDYIFENVFLKDDPALFLWTNSKNSKYGWELATDNIADTYGETGTGRSGPREEAESKHLEDRIVESAGIVAPATRVYDNALVYGNALVWGGSQISQNASVMQFARISGGSEVGGRRCNNTWLNSQRAGAKEECAHGGGLSFSYVSAGTCLIPVLLPFGVSNLGVFHEAQCFDR
ncbi:hypothetical protein [Candidatus Poriferisocius sp.]|uniref:hypothetical protein n=1 Tax=Candidatus Poriferisocius sp. TaxID=3101276 RepID=UPI003B5C0E25